MAQKRELRIHVTAPARLMQYLSARLSVQEEWAEAQMALADARTIDPKCLHNYFLWFQVSAAISSR